MQYIPYLALYLLLLNLLTMAFFLVDKRRAKQKKWRIRERTLLLLCGLGGCFGGLLGILAGHHKTKSFKFVLPVPLLCAAYTALLLYLFLKFGKAGI